MDVRLTANERAGLVAAAASERRVRHWRRYRAILLLGEGQSAGAVAAALGCSENSVSNWTRAWRRAGPAGLAEAPHSGRARVLDRPAETHLDGLLRSDPQAYGHHATGWTVPLLRTELAAAGYRVSAHTVRRTLHRLGWRWKRPKYLLGRPDPAYAEKKPPLLRGPRRCEPLGARSGSATRRPCESSRRCAQPGPGAVSRPRS